MTVQNNQTKAQNNLRKIRREFDLTQQQVADGSGVTRQTIIDIEKGHTKRPSDEVMIAIATFLGCEVEDIFFTPLVKHVVQKKETDDNIAQACAG